MNLSRGLALLFTLLIAGEAGAAEPSQRVALFPIEGDAALYARLTAELRAQGFEPIDVTLATRADGDPFPPLMEAMRITHAERALRVESAPRAIRLWIANASTGKQLLREAPTEAERADAAIVSLWAVEALRASAVAPEPIAPAAVVAAPPVPTPLPPPSLALALAPAALLSSGGVGPSAQVVVALRWAPRPRAGVELVMVLPTVPASLERPSGRTDVSIGILAAGPVLSLGGAETRWSANLSAGAALTLLRAAGSGGADHLGRTEHVLGAGPFARAGVALRLSRSSPLLRLRADGMVGATFPQPVIYFADERVADWGRPWLAGALGVEALF
jgi:hypothetical protein